MVTHYHPPTKNRAGSASEGVLGTKPAILDTDQPADVDMNYANQSEIWWPKPSALDDLHVEVTEVGDHAEMQLSAPDGSECAEWLAYFQETEERQAAFERALIQSLLDQIEMKRNGEVQGIPDKQN